MMRSSGYVLIAIVCFSVIAGKAKAQLNQSREADNFLDPERNRPVELIYFYGTSDEDSVTLFWGTATEIENFGFEIQRSYQDTTDWEPVGFVLGAGTSFSPRDYQYGDFTVADSGLYFYRLKQIDTNGDFKYSWTISVAFLITKAEIIAPYPDGFRLNQNYPNPFNPSTLISFEIPSVSKVNLSVYDIKGELIEELLSETLNGGEYLISFNAVALSTGIYFYRLETPSGILTRKMLVLK